MWLQLRRDIQQLFRDCRTPQGCTGAPRAKDDSERAPRRTSPENAHRERTANATQRRIVQAKAA